MAEELVCVVYLHIVTLRPKYIRMYDIYFKSHALASPEIFLHSQHLQTENPTAGYHFHLPLPADPTFPFPFPQHFSHVALCFLDAADPTFPFPRPQHLSHADPTFPFPRPQHLSQLVLRSLGVAVCVRIRLFQFPFSTALLWSSVSSGRSWNKEKSKGGLD